MSAIEFSTNRIWKNWQPSRAHQSIEDKLHAGYKKFPPAFTEHISTDQEMAAMQQWSDKLKSSGVEILVVCGMGGSSLGAKAIQSLLDPHSDQIFFWEGPHPQVLRHIGRVAENRKTALLVVSKSGNTLETRTNLALFRQFFPGVREYFITSEPDKIKDLGATKENTFLIPKPLGGRFSVMSPVGIMPGYFMGADMESLMRGFREGIEAWDIAIPVANNAAKIVAQQYFELFRAGYQGAIFWVYANDLMGWGRWLIQLWGESLGKKVEVQAVPLLNQGPEDQHSVLQYFMEGPNQFVHTFVHAGSYGTHDTVVPGDFPAESANHSLWEVLNAQMRSIELALGEENRPVSDFIVPEMDMYNLGKWFAFWMYIISYMGYLYDINPFDQPGVEKGKIYCKKLLTGIAVEPPTTKVLEL